jgi:hypothetical protein
VNGWNIGDLKLKIEKLKIEEQDFRPGFFCCHTPEWFNLNLFPHSSLKKKNENAWIYSKPELAGNCCHCSPPH